MSTVIVIRFERLAYTFLEPEFELEDGEEVFLVKDGFTELTYDVLVYRREEDPPTINVDYSTDIRVTGNIVTFSADQQRLQLFGLPDGAFALNLFPDNLPEGPESFQISSAPIGNPTYQRPATGVATFIIEDDDSMYGSYYKYSIISYIC